MTNRCYICNSTNNSGIATEPEDYRENNRIFPDPQDPIKDICQECHDTSQYCLNEMETEEDEETDLSVGLSEAKGEFDV